jgi:tetratricopeptide (TPR) repeat protein
MSIEEGIRLLEEEKGLALEEESLQKRVESIPGGYADIHNTLGLISHQKGDLPRAADCFRKALYLNPHYTEAALNLTVTLNDLGAYDEARQVMSKSALTVWADPNEIDPYVRKKMANEHAKLGDQYVELNIWSEGAEQYRKALQLCPDLADVMTKLGMTLRSQKEYDEAIDQLSRTEKMFPTHVPAMIQLGLTYYIKGFFGLAFAKWEQASKIEPAGKAALVYLRLANKKEEVIEDLVEEPV